MGTYYLLQNHAYFSKQVVYDRKDSAFSKSKINDFDFTSIFNDASYLVVSGITLALSDEMPGIVLEAVKEAKKQGMRVVFDFNY